MTKHDQADEVERLIDDARIKDFGFGQTSHRDAEVYSKGYRAGVAARDEEVNALRRAEANNSAALEGKCVHGTYNDTYVENLKLKNERLKEELGHLKDSHQRSLEVDKHLYNSLEAEKSKSQKLGEALRKTILWAEACLDRVPHSVKEGFNFTYLNAGREALAAYANNESGNEWEK